jgi:hypothetical protein
MPLVFSLPYLVICACVDHHGLPLINLLSLEGQGLWYLYLVVEDCTIVPYSLDNKEEETCWFEYPTACRVFLDWAPITFVFDWLFHKHVSLQQIL